MRAKWLRVTWLAGLAAACGAGHAIFNVDVYSFIKGTGKDTIPPSGYVVPPGPSFSASSVQKIDLPGAGSSIVDSVIVAGALSIQNQAGSGTIGLQIYLAADSAGTYNASALALTVPDFTVSGAAVTTDTIVGRLSAAVLSLFAGKTLWVRLQATATNNGAVPLQGKAVLTALRLTVVMDDKFF
jgi:hypothetical protein